jgi:transposase InsO family protein
VNPVRSTAYHLRRRDERSRNFGSSVKLYLAVENIDHSRTKAKSPQTNGICERFHRTLQEEFYSVAFRKKLYRSLDELQADLEVSRVLLLMAWLVADRGVLPAFPVECCRTSAGGSHHEAFWTYADRYGRAGLVPYCPRRRTET